MNREPCDTECNACKCHLTSVGAGGGQVGGAGGRDRWVGQVGGTGGGIGGWDRWGDRWEGRCTWQLATVVK